MSEEDQVIDENIEQSPETDEAVETPENDEVESRARSMGWAPKEEFRGDPDRWVDAETFVERGEKQLPIMRERYKKLEQDLRETRETMRQFAEHHKKVDERAYQRALEDIRRKKLAAFQDSDSEAFLAAEKEEEALRENKPQPIEVPKDDPNDDPTFVAWVNENPWYTNDRVMAASAEAIAEDLAKKGYTGVALLEKVAQQVKSEFPHKFGNSRRNRPGAVESPSPKSRKTGKSIADLPAEAKSACQKFVKQGLMTEEQYVREYFGE